MLLVRLSYVPFTLCAAEVNGPVYIRADGSIDPPDAPITTTDQTTYTLTGDIRSDSHGLVVERYNITIDGAGYRLLGPANVSDGHGVHLEVDNVTIQHSTIAGFLYGVWIAHSSNHILRNNDIIGNYVGVRCSFSDHNDISRNHLRRSGWGAIELEFSNYVSISGNDIVDGHSISVLYTHFFSITGNNISSDLRQDGIEIDSSYFGNISDNTLINQGLHVDDNAIFYELLVENNTVNGRPLVYLQGVSNYTIEDAGQVILVGCDRITVEGLNLSSKTWAGLHLLDTDNCTISGNYVANNDYGIYLEWSYNNSISENIVVGNTYAIHVGGRDNVVFHNTFLRSTLWHSQSRAGNIWDDGYPSGGNYWDDYTGTDLFSGPYQNESGSDGIGDVPFFTAPGDGWDRYPLITPSVWWNHADVNHDFIVDIYDATAFALAYGSTPMCPHWNPLCDIADPYGIINIFDVVVMVGSYGEACPS
jgi:parallel beta-helix repeat protein